MTIKHIYFTLIYNFMSAICTYICTNEDCDFELRLNKNFPVWKEDTPQEYRKIPVGSARQKYLQASKSEYFCKHCKTVVAVVEPIWYPFPKFKDGSSRYFIGKARRFCAFFGYYPKTKYICPKCTSVNSLLINEFLNDKTCPLCQKGIIQEDRTAAILF